jgi:hypothetical protein
LVFKIFQKYFSEILPGLGGSLKPGVGENGSEALELFILNLVNHFFEVDSQSLRVSEASHNIHKVSD